MNIDFNAYYFIVNQLAGRYLDASGSKGDDDNVYANPSPLYNNNQHWQFIPIAGETNTYRIVNKLDLGYLDAKGSSKDKNGNVYVNKKSSSDSQKWKIEPISTDAELYQIININSEGNRYLDASGSKGENNNAYANPNENNSKNQTWYILCAGQS